MDAARSAGPWADPDVFTRSRRRTSGAALPMHARICGTMACCGEQNAENVYHTTK